MEYFVQSYFIFEKMHKVSKNNAQGCCTPLKMYPNVYYSNLIIKMDLSGRHEVLVLKTHCLIKEWSEELRP